MLNESFINREEYRRLSSDIAYLKKLVLELIKDELDPAVVKRLEKESAILDKGEGRRFSSLKQFKSYLRRL